MDGEEWEEEEWDKYCEHCHDMVLSSMEFVRINGDEMEQRRLALKWMLEGHLGVAFFHAFDRDTFVEEFEELKTTIVREYTDKTKGEGRLNSGYWTGRFFDEIKEKFPTIHSVYRELGRHFKVKSGWLLYYALHGHHKRHSDNGYDGGYRAIMNILEGEKTFTFYYNEKTVVKFKLHHGMVVVMSDHLGGVHDDNREHSGDGAEGTGFFGVDLLDE